MQTTEWYSYTGMFMAKGKQGDKSGTKNNMEDLLLVEYLVRLLSCDPFIRHRQNIMGW